MEQRQQFENGRLFSGSPSSRPTATSTGHSRAASVSTEHSSVDSLNDGNVVYLEDERDKFCQNYSERNTIRTMSRPEEKLGGLSLYCLIANKTIGTGIFTSAGVILEHTGSKGVALLLWLVGIVVMFAGLQTYLELALSTPRYRLNSDNSLKVVYRSGAEKVYLKYIFNRISSLIVCVYGITYITISGMASGNSITFATSILSTFYDKEGLDDGEKKGHVTGLAIGVLALACMIHGVWRTGGIWLNNTMGLLKTAFLIGTILIGFKSRAEQFEPTKDNLKFNGLGNLSHSFSETSENKRDHIVAMNLILFTMSGFEVGSMVLGEVEQPRKVFPKAAIRSFAFISALYFAFTCVLYQKLDITELVRSSNTPAEKEFKGSYITQGYYKKMFGEKSRAPEIASWFIAFSALGNILVVTFTAARVIQEIAKEGIFPTIAISKFFMREFYSPVNALWNMLRGQKAIPTFANGDPLFDRAFDKAEMEMFEKRANLKANMTPIPALFLHFIVSALLVVVATQGLNPTDGIYFLFQLNPYITYTLIGILMSVGLIYLQWRKDDSYRQPELRWYWKVGSIGFRQGRIWTPIYLAGMIVMMVLNWLPPTGKHASTDYPSIPGKFIKDWYLAPLVGTSIFFGISPLYWALREAWLRWTGDEIVVESRVFVRPDTWEVVDELTNIEKVDRRGAPAPPSHPHPPMVVGGGSI